VDWLIVDYLVKFGGLGTLVLIVLAEPTEGKTRLPSCHDRNLQSLMITLPRILKLHHGIDSLLEDEKRDVRLLGGEEGKKGRSI
jgi:hypothetical protein